MAVFGTSDAVMLPKQIADGIVTSVRSESTVAKLSQREPMRFGEVSIVTFEEAPRAEFVGEGAEKSSSKGKFGVVTAQPRKAQVTQRFNEEVLWADEDYQLEILSTLSREASKSLSRALDLGLYHRMNPLSGQPIDTWTNYVDATTRRVESEGAPDMEIEAAAGLLIPDGVALTGMAFDPAFAWQLATARYEDGRKKFPEIGLGTAIESFGGVPAAVGDTVSGRPEAADSEGDPADTNVRAILGDFRDGIRWGIQRDIPLEVIRYGDPDGNGDLKRLNQIALRLEILYAWYVFVDRFAVIEVVPEEGNGGDGGNGDGGNGDGGDGGEEGNGD